MECECGDPRFFHKGWRNLLFNIVYSITGFELLDGMSSKRKRGVYIIVMVDTYNEEVNIKYIGSSSNMKKRLYEGVHHVYDTLYKEALDSHHKTCVVFYIDTSNYLEIEITLIKALRPDLNVHHNGN